MPSDQPLLLWIGAECRSVSYICKIYFLTMQVDGPAKLMHLTASILGGVGKNKANIYATK